MFFINKQFQILLRLSIVIVACFLFGCKKQVQVEPPYNNTNAGNVFNDDATARAALTGIYTQMANNSNFTGSGSIGLYAGLSSDELNLFNGVSDFSMSAYYKNSLASNEAVNYGTEAWASLYDFIYQCNAAIEGLSVTNSLTPSIKKQLLGEAKFLRGFFYFYLVNLYGDLPLVLSTDYKVNALLTKNLKSDVYQQIEKDLNEAHDLLSVDYLDGALISYPGLSERVRR